VISYRWEARCLKVGAGDFDGATPTFENAHLATKRLHVSALGMVCRAHEDLRVSMSIIYDGGLILKPNFSLPTGSNFHCAFFT
jgi:hypothetical protein